MRVLIVTHNYLSGFGGGAYGARAYINAFSALYDDVTLLYPVQEGNTAPTEISPRVRMIGVADPVSALHKAGRILFKGVLHRFEKPFRDLLSRETFDIIVFQNSKCSSRIIRQAQASGARIAVIHDNYEKEYTRDNTPFLLRPLLLPAVVKTERNAVREADLNLVLTPDDAHLLENCYGEGKKGRIERWGSFEYKPAEMWSPHTVSEPVFAITGNLGAMQTLSSLIPWLSDYYPLLKSVIPGARLVVAGKNPSAELKRFLSVSGAELIDTPADMTEVLRRAKYYVCPVDCGGGIKLRVMDGLRQGLPVLVHKVSARGYEAFQGISLFAYEDRDSFRTALQALLECPGSQDTRRQLYLRHFSFDAGVARLRKILEECQFPLS